MRKTLTVVLISALAASAPATIFAATKAPVSGQTGTLTGVAQGTNNAALSNYMLRVRDAGSGQVIGSTTSSQTGAFAFAALQPSSYVVEIVDAASRVVGVSPTIPIGARTAVHVRVTATAPGAMAQAAAGGFSLLGLGPAASVAIVTAVVVAGTVGTIVAVKAVREDASPSN